MILSRMRTGFQRLYLCHLSSLLLVVTATSAATAERQETEGYNESFPPLWFSVPGNLVDYTMKENKIIINPWNYRERMGMYKMLLNNSTKYYATLEPHKSGNILWGLALQHGWQYSTGRLADPATTACGHDDGDRHCISAQSWWACMNYYLAVIPYLAALETGLFGHLPYEVEMLPPEEQRTDFCYSIAECNTQAPKVMSSWRDFFKYLSSTTVNFGSPAAATFSKDEALKYMWEAHVLSISYAFLKFQNRLLYLSSPESNFGEDWSTAVEFIAATRFPTDQNTTNRFQTGLPPRTLLNGDKVPFIPDFTPVQNKVLLMLSGLRKTNDMTGKTLLLLWKQAMSTEEGRKFGRSIIESVV